MRRRAVCPQGHTHCTCWARVPAAGVRYVPRAVAPQAAFVHRRQRPNPNPTPSSNPYPNLTPNPTPNPRFWQHILDDAQLGHVFARPDGRRRTAQDLKDKWATLMREETRG